MHVPKQKQPRQIKIIEKIEVQQPVLPKETITQVEEHHIASVIEQQPVQIEPIVSTEAIVPTIREERALPPIEPLVAMRVCISHFFTTTIQYRKIFYFSVQGNHLLKIFLSIFKLAETQNH